MSKSIKKLFVFFGIFAACLILFLCALSACDDVVQTAEAYTTLRTNDGVVLPNVLPYYNFSSLTYVSSYNGLDSEGLYTTINSLRPSVDGSLTFGFSVSTTYFFRILFFAPYDGYYSLSMYSPTISVNSEGTWHSTFMIKDSNVDICQINNSDSVSSVYSDTIFRVNASPYLNNLQYHTAGSLVTFSFVTSGTGTFTGSMMLKYLKVEHYTSVPSSYQYTFSGFAIPGITYQDNGGVTPDPEPGYWDDWDGVVRPNRLRNSSEFVDGTGWVLPSDAVIDEQLITVSSSTDPVLIKNRTSRSFEPNQGEYLTLSCYLTDISGSAQLMVTGTSVTLVSDTADLVEGLNYVTFELDTLGGVEVTPEFAIYLSANSSVSIDWVKMERGGLFTGYVVNVDELYDLAYSQGYFDGSQAYAFRSFEYNFDNVETNWIQEGWSDWGISDEHELSEVFFSLKSYWFEEQGYNITSNGRFMLFETSNNVTHYGVLLYVSTGEITSISDVYNTEYPIVTVTVFEDRIGFGVRDSNFPDPWNPIQYPNARKVLINCQLGIQQWLDNVSSAADKMGYQRGLDEGYASGRESGYRDGFNYGYEQTQNGTWRGMISALIGVPVTYLVSLFNFEILGFNFLSVFKTIVVISLFLFIVKTLLGKVSA